MAILIRDYTSIYNVSLPSINVKVGADQVAPIDSVGTRMVIQAAPRANFEERLINVGSPTINVKVGADQVAPIDSVGTRMVIQAAPTTDRVGDVPVSSSEDSEPVVAGKLQQWIG